MRISHPFQFKPYLGTVFQTYLLFDLGEELGLIDQHAAHERIRYEKLRKTIFKNDRPTIQALLLPEALQFDAEQLPIIEERLNLLTQMGFEVEVFSGQSVLFRGVPAAWGTDSLRIRLKSLLERVLELPKNEISNQTLMDETLFEKLASEACHSAIRAGDHLEREEGLSLVDDLFACEHPWNCPHGRPTVARVPKTKFEEWFSRKI